MKFGIIDIGSNNVRYAVWEIYGKGYYRMIDEIKENVRLGAETLSPSISPDRINAAVAALRRFRDFSESLDVSRTVVVATEAVRRASNREEFLNRVREEVGYDPIVLSEYEEAYLVYKGVTGSMEVKNSLMIDIGGTSTELVWIKDGEMMESASFPIGTITLTEKYQLQNIVNPKNHTAMEESLKEAFGSIPWIRDKGYETLISVGGSARTMGRIDRHKKRYPITLTHNYTLNDLDINQMYYSMLTKDAHMRSKTDGLERDRSDIILGALSITNTILKITGLQEIRISGKGLREGILFEHLNAEYERYPNMLDASIYSVLARHDMDTSHAEHVLKLTFAMFDGLKEVHRIAPTYRDIVKTSAMLHDVGMSITYYDHEKHSFYIILNSEINGLNHREVLLAAFAAKFHKKYDSGLSITVFSHMINKLDLFIAEKIGILIALSEAFDRNLRGLVRDVECRVTEESVILTPISDEDISTEIIEAMKVSEKFRELFKKTLIITRP